MTSDLLAKLPLPCPYPWWVLRRRYSSVAPLQRGIRRLSRACLQRTQATGALAARGFQSGGPSFHGMQWGALEHCLSLSERFMTQRSGTCHTVVSCVRLC